MLEILYESALVLNEPSRNVPMPRAEVTIKTHDGNCPASVLPLRVERGPWPAVIFYMDGLGIRPVMWEMGQRLADGGYLVPLPSLLSLLELSTEGGFRSTGQSEIDGRSDEMG
jgi:dienelactone hydrolase